MSKKRLQNYLNEILSFLSDDDKARNAIDYLSSQVSSKEEPVSGNAETPVFSKVIELQAENSYALFSDGACRGNPGPGAWACMGQDKSGKVIFSDAQAESHTTNNKMEMKGAIAALDNLQNYIAEKNLKLTEILLFTDSKYIVDGINKWVPGWKDRGWKKADKKAPENLDLWQRLDELHHKLPVEFHWVKGHAGHPQNEFCDSLANKILDHEGY